jgi:hypothetical protein
MTRVRVKKGEELGRAEPAPTPPLLKYKPVIAREFQWDIGMTEAIRINTKEYAV